MRYLILVLFSITTALSLVVAATPRNDMTDCLELKQKGQLLAQRLEESKSCQGSVKDSLVCTYRTEQTHVRVTSYYLGGDPKKLAQSQYDVLSLDPRMSLSYTKKSDPTWLFLRWKEPAPHGCDKDWTFITDNGAVIANTLLNVMGTGSQK